MVRKPHRHHLTPPRARDDCIHRVQRRVPGQRDLPAANRHIPGLVSLLRSVPLLLVALGDSDPWTRAPRCSLVELPFRALWAGLKRLPSTKTGTAALSAHPTVQRFDASRRVFLRRSVYGLTAATFAGTAYGMIVEKQGCEITESTILVPGLPRNSPGTPSGWSPTCTPACTCRQQTCAGMSAC